MTLRCLGAMLVIVSLFVCAVTGGVVSVDFGDGVVITQEVTENNGVDCLLLEDFLNTLRTVDPNLTAQWDNAQTFRMRIFGARVSMFTDRALILVESRLHPTASPLATRGGDILVPAGNLRDLLDLLPGAPAVTVTLPSAVAPVIDATPLTPLPVEPEPTRIAPPPPVMPAPTINIPTENIAPISTTPAVPIPTMTSSPQVARTNGESTIALVSIAQHVEDIDILNATADLLSRQIEAGTQSDVFTVTVTPGQWEEALRQIETAEPRLTLAIQVGHSANDALMGAGLYRMTPNVDQGASAAYPRPRAERYRDSTALSDLLARSLETEMDRTQISWLGSLPMPHHLLRLSTCPAALIEMGQASNPDEAALLRDPAHQAQIAGAIAQGVINWWQWTEANR